MTCAGLRFLIAGLISSAWNTLGPDRRFITPVYALGTRQGPGLDGNLVMVASGDLTMGGRTTKTGAVAFTNIDHGDANSVPGATLTPQDPLAGLDQIARQVRDAASARCAAMSSSMTGCLLLTRC